MKKSAVIIHHTSDLLPAGRGYKKVRTVRASYFVELTDGLIETPNPDLPEEAFLVFRCPSTGVEFAKILSSEMWRPFDPSAAPTPGGLWEQFELEGDPEDQRPFVTENGSNVRPELVVAGILRGYGKLS